MSYELALVFGVTVIPFILAFLSSKTKREELQILFVSMCLLFVTIDFYFLHVIADEGGYASIAGVLEMCFVGFFWVFFLVVALFMIMFIYSVFKIGQDQTDRV